jgi:hypothetical protein
MGDKMKKITAILIVAMMLCLASNASAALIVYTDQSAWSSAISALGGSIDISEDFNSFTTDTSLAVAGGVDFGSFTLEQTAGAIGSEIDVPPYDANWQGNGTPFAAIWGGSTRVNEVVFDSQVLGFGGLVNPFGTIFTLSTNLTASLSGDTAVWASGTTATFLGVAVDDVASAFISATWSGGGGFRVTQSFGIDDFQAATAGAPIPEPSTMLLLGSGLAGLGFFRRRRKRPIT